jgi:hypothetical protein
MRAPASLRPIFLYRTDHTAVDQVSRSLSFLSSSSAARRRSEERDEGNHHCGSTKQGRAGTAVCEGSYTPVVLMKIRGCGWCIKYEDSASIRVPLFVLVHGQIDYLIFLNTEHRSRSGWVRVSKPQPCSLASQSSGGSPFRGSSKTPASDTVTRGSTGPLGDVTGEFTSKWSSDSRWSSQFSSVVGDDKLSSRISLTRKYGLFSRDRRP